MAHNGENDTVSKILNTILKEGELDNFILFGGSYREIKDGYLLPILKNLRNNGFNVAYLERLRHPEKWDANYMSKIESLDFLVLDGFIQEMLIDAREQEKLKLLMNRKCYKLFTSSLHPRAIFSENFQSHFDNHLFEELFVKTKQLFINDSQRIMYATHILSDMLHRRRKKDELEIEWRKNRQKAIRYLDGTTSEFEEFYLI